MSGGALSYQLKKLQLHRWEFSRGPLAWAVSCGLEDVVAKLIAEGAELNERDSQGRTALHECCQLVNDAKRQHLHRTAESICKLLLDHGANANATTFCAQTPMHFLFLPSEAKGKSQSSMSRPRRAVLKLLLEWGADVTIKDHNAYTPLHYCAKRNMVDCLRVFVSYGSSIYLCTSTGSSVLHLACQGKCLETIRWLCHLEADAYSGLLELRDKRGRTPLHILHPSYAECVTNLWLAARKGDENALRKIVTGFDSVAPTHKEILDRDEEQMEVAETSEGEEGPNVEEIEGPKNESDEDRDTDDVVLTKALTERSPSKKLQLKHTYETQYVEGINSKTIRMRWSCLHACLAGIGRGKNKELQKVDILRYLVQAYSNYYLAPNLLIVHIVEACLHRQLRCQLQNAGDVFGNHRLCRFVANVD